jgi:tetratricopeptide (TPR) repeat protein/tRNA A-37 threonylcarbamoyl transferase component Bud32
MMSNPTDRLWPPLEPQRKDAVERHSGRSTQRRSSVTTAQDAGPNGSVPLADTDEQSRSSTTITTSSSELPAGIDLSALRLSSSDAWKLCQSDEEVQSQGLHYATKQASNLITKLHDKSNYLDSAKSAWDDLCIARRQLQVLLDADTSADEPLRFKATRTLANIYHQLGDYDTAQTILKSICPSLPLDCAAFGDLLEWHRIDAFLDYLRFLAVNARDLEQAESFAKMLPWATPDILRSEDRRTNALLSLIQVLNGQGRHEEAHEALKTFRLVASEQSLLDPEFHLHEAIAAAGQGMQREAEVSFAHALILSSVLKKPWHSQTLHILTQIGRVLRAWHKHELALKLLTLSCHGYYYKLGISHPRSIQAYKELQACKGAEPAMEKLRQLSHSQFSQNRVRSMVYEQGHLNTPVELFSSAISVDFERVSNSLDQLLSIAPFSKEVVFNAKRNIAWCTMEQHKLNEASAAFNGLQSSIGHIDSDTVGAEAYRALLATDEAICSSKRTDAWSEFTRQRSKLAYLALRNIPKRRSHQAKATLRRLYSHGLTHFTRQQVFEDPSLITETNRESLGSGSSATVDTVQIGRVFYARKSINYPRQVGQQHRLKEDIQKEIKITQTLSHPHIVKVLLTYEETRRFSIIIHPLADCDLESYLANKACAAPPEKFLVRKWMACLSNTLAYIHSKDIRHKDIKPRNILVKGEKVYFTDFGSSHMFDDSGNSTTEGVAHGHTRAYCAPEVIRNTSRHRSSDVFSLGCVLTEMAAWCSGISMSDYFDGIRAEPNSTDTVQYHDSISRVKLWFEKEPQLTQESKNMYHEVIRNMICKSSQARWTAIEVSRAFSRVIPYKDCVRCGIDLWVSTSTAS